MQHKFISSFQVNPPMSSLARNKNKAPEGGYLCSNIDSTIQRTWKDANNNQTLRKNNNKKKNFAKGSFTHCTGVNATIPKRLSNRMEKTKQKRIPLRVVSERFLQKLNNSLRYRAISLEKTWIYYVICYSFEVL